MVGLTPPSGLSRKKTTRFLKCTPPLDIKKILLIVLTNYFYRVDKAERLRLHSSSVWCVCIFIWCKWSIIRECPTVNYIYWSVTIEVVSPADTGLRYCTGQRTRLRGGTGYLANGSLDPWLICYAGLTTVSLVQGVVAICLSLGKIKDLSHMLEDIKTSPWLLCV